MTENKRILTIDEALDDMNVLLERISNQYTKKGWVYVQDINPQAVDMAVCALEGLNQAILDLKRYEEKEE